MGRLFFIIIIFSLLFVGGYLVLNTDFLRLPLEKKGQRGIVIIDNVEIEVEIVQTEAQKSQGLSERTSLPQKNGMLFVYDKSEIYTFWMKDMKFSIDIIWIRDGRVVDITSNVPVPGQDIGLSDLPRYTPKEPVNFVLEVNAGFAKAHDMNVGDTVNIIIGNDAAVLI